jgi:hypothetical protein
MINRFHIAIAAGDLDLAMSFYCDTLGRCTGNSGEGWVDIDFWGNELTLHASTPKPQPNDQHLHTVEDEMVIVPHFGVHLSVHEYHQLLIDFQTKGVKYVSEPYTRFQYTELEQKTLFIEDPNQNVIELKTMRSPDALFTARIN